MNRFVRLVYLLNVLIFSLPLSGCLTTFNDLTWLPATFSKDKPLLAQLETGKYRASFTAQGLAKDVKQEQSSGLGLLSIPLVEENLNLALNIIKEASGFSAVPGSVYVLASPTMNAMTKADGNIYVPIGMLVDIESRDELMALLSHEFAHVLLNHTDTDLLTNIQKKAVAGYAVIQRLSNGSKNNELSQRVRNTLAFSITVDRLLHPTWSRQQELAADKLAIDLLVAAGRDPNAMIVLLRRLENWKKVNSNLENENKKLTSHLVEAAISRYANESWQASLMQAFTPFAYSLESEIESMSATHLNIEARIDAARDYLRQFYRRTTRPEAETVSWRKIARSPDVMRQVTAVREAHSAFNELLRGNMTMAEKGLQRIPSQSSANQNYFRMLRAMLAERRGKHDDVKNISETIKDLKYPSYRLLVMDERARQTLEGRGEVQSVEKLYSEFDMYGRPNEFYADLIALAANTGNRAFHYSILLRCHADTLGIPAACDGSESPSTQDTDSGGIIRGLTNIFSKR